MAAPYVIRLFGDPVLRTPAHEVTEIDGRVARLAEDMLATMYDAPGIGLAAPQVGVQQRLFVCDVADGQEPRVLVNPVVVEARGEEGYEEGCLSLPGLQFEVVRPSEVHVRAIDLEGAEVALEADGILARVFQHEIDHLDGVLFLDRLDDDTRKQALKAWRERTLVGPAGATDPAPGIGPQPSGLVRRLRLPGH